MPQRLDDILSETQADIKIVPPARAKWPSNRRSSNANNFVSNHARVGIDPSLRINKVVLYTTNTNLPKVFDFLISHGCRVVGEPLERSSSYNDCHVQQKIGTHPNIQILWTACLQFNHWLRNNSVPIPITFINHALMAAGESTKIFLLARSAEMHGKIRNSDSTSGKMFSAVAPGPNR
jgi:hypothetical protein